MPGWTLDYDPASFGEFTLLGPYVNELSNAFNERASVTGGADFIDISYRTPFGFRNYYSNPAQASEWMYYMYRYMRTIIQFSSYWCNQTDSGGNWEQPIVDDFAPLWTMEDLLLEAGYAGGEADWIDPSEYTEFTLEGTVDFIIQNKKLISLLIWRVNNFSHEDLDRYDKFTGAVATWPATVIDYNNLNWNHQSAQPSTLQSEASDIGGGNFTIRRGAHEGGFTIPNSGNTFTYDWDFYVGFEHPNPANPNVLYHNDDYPLAPLDEWYIVESGAETNGDPFHNDFNEVDVSNIQQPPAGKAWGWDAGAGSGKLLRLIRKWDVVDGFVYY